MKKDSPKRGVLEIIKKYFHLNYPLYKNKVCY